MVVFLGVDFLISNQEIGLSGFRVKTRAEGHKGGDLNGKAKI